ncbi:MAG: hypothetical protein RLZZ110_1735 [Bacteroidota bacterium]|jgi:hypothetical protein
MLRYLLLFSLLPFFGYSQNNTVLQSCNELGLSYKIDKKQSLGLELTTRFDVAGLQTIFPQVSYKYKINKYLKPSLDYRLIGSKDDFGNFTIQHRLNANLQFAHEIKQFELGLRLRYQFSANRSQTDFGSEFNNAIRFKPSIAYNLDNSKITPSAGMELFYNPMDGQVGYHLSRIRWNVGVAIDLKGASDLEIGYIYDQRIHNPGALNRAILNLSYGYALEANTKKDKAKHRTPHFL